MENTDTVVAAFADNQRAEAAIKALSAGAIGMKQLSGR